MWTDAFAQIGGSAPPESNPTMSLLLTLLQFLPIFLILYFLLIRPQQQRQKKAKKMLGELKKGDKVVTNGGIYGTVVQDLLGRDPTAAGSGAHQRARLYPVREH